MSTEGGTRAVIAALLANLGIAATKFIAFFLTGFSSMLAEAIHSVADIESCPWPPKMVNIKPSRFGPLSELFAAYDHCDAKGIGAYGGGQWELGPGRGQIQYLASVFHPDTPNDVAPSGYNTDPYEPDHPTSPLEPAAPATS